MLNKNLFGLFAVDCNANYMSGEDYDKYVRCFI